MKIININVIDKIAISPDAVIVCGNDDYYIDFTFDEEWQSENIKTARFIYNGIAEDVVFEGNSVNVPRLSNATTLAVGVFAGDLHTTTPALIGCKKSILCEDGLPPDPTPEVYAQIIDLLNRKSGINFAQFDIDTSDGNLYLFAHYEHESPHFELNASGELEVVFDEV